jgi:hypothetical protein
MPIPNIYTRYFISVKSVAANRQFYVGRADLIELVFFLPK